MIFESNYGDNSNSGNSSANANFPAYTPEDRKKDKEKEKLTMSDYTDTDTFGTEIAQALVYQPMSLRVGTWDRTLDQWWNDKEGDGGKLNPSGLYTMVDKSWQEQNGWEKAETVVDTLSGVSTWAGVGLIAAGVLQSLTGIGAATGVPTMATGAGLLGLGVGEKALASSAIKNITKYSEKALKAKSLIKDTSFLESIGKATTKDEVKYILDNKFKTKELDGVLGENLSNGLSDILSKETDLDTINSSLDHAILNSFDTNTKPMLKEIKAGNELKKLSLAEEELTKTTYETAIKGTPYEKLKKDVQDLNSKLSKESSRIRKGSNKYLSSQEELAGLNTKWKQLDSNAINDSKIITEFAERKGIAEAEFKTIEKEIGDLKKLVIDSEKTGNFDEITRTLKSSDFVHSKLLTESEKNWMIKEITKFKTSEPYIIKASQVKFNSALDKFLKKANEVTKKSIKSSADKAFLDKQKMIGKATKIRGTLFSKMSANAGKLLDRAIKADAKNIKDFKEGEYAKHLKANKKKLKSAIKKEFASTFRKAAKKLTNNKTILNKIDKMENIGDVVKIQKMLQTKITDKIDGIVEKEIKFVSKNKRQVYKKLTSPNGKINSTIKFLEDKSGTLGIDVEGEIMSLKIEVGNALKRDPETMTPIQLEEATNKILNALSSAEEKFYQKTVNSEVKRTLAKNIATLHADMIKEADFKYLKDLFEGDGIFNWMKRAMHDLGTNGNHYDVLDQYAIEKGMLKQIFFNPQKEAKDFVDRTTYAYNSEIDEIIKARKLEAEHLKRTQVYMVTRRWAGKDVVGKADEVRKNRAWLVNEEWKTGEELIDHYNIDVSKIKDKTNRIWEEKMNKLEQNGGKELKKFEELSDAEKKFAKEAEFRYNAWDEIHLRLRDEIINGTSKQAKGMKEFINVSSKYVRAAREKELETLRVFDPKQKVPKNIPGWLAPMPLKRIKGTDTFLKVKDNSIYEHYINQGGDKVYDKVTNRALHRLTGKTNPDFEFHWDPVAAVNKGLKRSLSYSSFRKAEYQIKHTLNEIEDITGKNFTENVKLEIFTNFNEAMIRQKNWVDEALDKLSRNAVYGILGFKATTPAAQLSAVPEWIATFYNPLDGVKAWMNGSAVLGQNKEIVREFLKHNSGEFVERTSPIMSSSKSSAKTIIGSGEVNEGISKYSSKAAQRYETFKEASLAPIKLMDKIMYENAFVGSYLHVLGKNGIDWKQAGDAIWDTTNPALKQYVDEAAQMIAEGQGSFSITNKSMFLKIGKLGNHGADGSMQSWVRAFTLLQSFVYNSMYRMYNNGIIKPSKIWKSGDKIGAAKKVTSVIFSETMGKAMYLENLERVNRMQELLTGGDYDDEKYDRDPIGSLAGEYFGHIPVVSSIYNTFNYSTTGGIPSHIDGVLGATNLFFDNTLGDRSWSDMSAKDWKKFAKAGFIATGVPLNEPMNMIYKYKDNHTPEYEKDKLAEYIAKQKVAEDNENIVNWYTDDPNKERTIGGKTFTSEQVLSNMKVQDPRRFEKLKFKILLEENYSDMRGQIEKVLKYTNENKAKYIVSLDGEERAKFTNALNNLGKLSKDLRKKIKIEEEKAKQ